MGNTFGPNGFSSGEHPSLQIAVPQIIIHKAHQPDVVVHFFDAHSLSGKDLAEIDFFLPQTDSAAASDWQNGIAERWVESCRRDSLDHVIAFNERHLKRLLTDYVRYHHEDRTHLGLRKETPAGRVQSTDRGAVVSQARLGGLHHLYDRVA